MHGRSPPSTAMAAPSSLRQAVQELHGGPCRTSRKSWGGLAFGALGDVQGKTRGLATTEEVVLREIRAAIGAGQRAVPAAVSPGPANPLVGSRPCPRQTNGRASLERAERAT